MVVVVGAQIESSTTDVVGAYNIVLQNEEVCGNTIYSSSEASGVNNIIHLSLRLR